MPGAGLPFEADTWLLLSLFEGAIAVLVQVVVFRVIVLENLRRCGQRSLRSLHSAFTGLIEAGFSRTLELLHSRISSQDCSSLLVGEGARSESAFRRLDHVEYRGNQQLIPSLESALKRRPG